MAKPTLELARLARTGPFLATGRYAFYVRVARECAVVWTGELQSWASFLFCEGVP